MSDFTFAEAVAGLSILRQKHIEKVIERNEWIPSGRTHASQCGHKCENYLIHSIRNYDQKRPVSVELQQKFTSGIEGEKSVLKELADLGLEVSHQQTALVDEKLKVSGKIDGLITNLIPGEKVVLEIKTTSAYYKHMTLQEMADHNFYCRYPGQMILYLYLRELRYGLFVFKCRDTGIVTFQGVDLYENMGYAEALIQKIERVNGFLSAGTLPPPKYIPDLCDTCDYEHICCPPRIYEAQLQVIEDEHIQALVACYASTKAEADYHAKVKDELKEHFKGMVGTRICGGFVIEGKPHGKGTRLEIRQKAGD